MLNPSTNLRKAAVLLRSVDAETAATLLAQLSTDEAMTLREAMRGLGALDPEEQAVVLAEFRRGKPLAGQPANRGVELSLSSADAAVEQPVSPHPTTTNKRFEFLDGAVSFGRFGFGELSADSAGKFDGIDLCVHARFLPW